MIAREELDRTVELGAGVAKLRDPDQGIDGRQVRRRRLGELKEPPGVRPRPGELLTVSLLPIFGCPGRPEGLPVDPVRLLNLLDQGLVAAAERLRIRRRVGGLEVDVRGQRLPVADQQVPLSGRQRDLAEAVVRTLEIDEDDRAQFCPGIDDVERQPRAVGRPADADGRARPEMRGDPPPLPALDVHDEELGVPDLIDRGDLGIGDAPPVGRDLEDREAIAVCRALREVPGPGAVGMDEGQPASVLRVAVHRAGGEPCAVAGRVEHQVFLGDRQPGPARAVGVDAPGLELLPGRSGPRTDHDLPPLVDPERLAPAFEDPSGWSPARQVVDPDPGLLRGDIPVEARIHEGASVGGHTPRAERHPLVERPPPAGLRVDGRDAHERLDPGFARDVGGPDDDLRGRAVLLLRGALTRATGA